MINKIIFLSFLILFSNKVKSQKINFKFVYCYDTSKQIEKSKEINIYKIQNFKTLKLSKYIKLLVYKENDSIKFNLIVKNDTIKTALIPISYLKTKQSIIYFQKYSNFKIFNEFYSDENSKQLTILLNCRCMQSLFFNQFEKLKLDTNQKKLLCSVAIINSDLHYQKILYNYQLSKTKTTESTQETNIKK